MRYYIILALIAVASLVGFSTLRKDIYICTNTTLKKTHYKIFGFTFSVIEEDTEISRWLKSEFGITGPRVYDHYVGHHPMLSIVSSPPGNWLVLRNLEAAWYKSPESHDRIREILNRDWRNTSNDLHGVMSSEDFEYIYLKTR